MRRKRRGRSPPHSATARAPPGQEKKEPREGGGREPRGGEEPAVAARGKRSVHHRSGLRTMPAPCMPTPTSPRSMARCQLVTTSTHRRTAPFRPHSRQVSRRHAFPSPLSCCQQAERCRIASRSSPRAPFPLCPPFLSCFCAGADAPPANPAAAVALHASPCQAKLATATSQPWNFRCLRVRALPRPGQAKAMPFRTAAVNSVA